MPFTFPLGGSAFSLNLWPHPHLVEHNTYHQPGEPHKCIPRKGFLVLNLGLQAYDTGCAVERLFHAGQVTQSTEPQFSLFYKTGFSYTYLTVIL